MKKYRLIKVAAIAIFFAAFGAWADTETVGGYTWMYWINGDTAEISAISPSPTGAVAVPSTLGGKPVTSIGDRAFENCGSLTGVTIPDSVTSIGKWAFHDGECSIRSFSVSSANRSFKVVNGFLLSYDGTVLVACPSAKGGTVAIPAGVAKIAATAFDDCDNMTAVTFPDSLSSIDEYAFHDCGQLVSVTLPDSVTNIGPYAFSKCKNLVRAELSARFNGTLDGTVFSNCAKNPAITFRAPSGGSQAGVRVATHYDTVYATVGQPLLNPDTGVEFVDNDFCDIDNYGGEDMTESATINISGFPSWLVWDSYVFAQSGRWDKTKRTRRSWSEATPWYDGGNYYKFHGTPTAAGEWTLKITASWNDGVSQTVSIRLVVLGYDCTVAFNANGGSVSPATRTVASGAAIGTLPTPTRSGYTFAGWWTAASGGTQITSATKVTANATYYAHWSAAVQPGTIVASAPTPLSVKAGETLRMKFARQGGSDGKIAVKAKTQTSTALMGVDGSADFDYVKEILEWDDGDATEKYIDVPTYVQPWEGTKQLRVKLSTLATGAYAGNLVPKLEVAKIYVDLENPSKFGTVSVTAENQVAGEPLRLAFRRAGGSSWPIAVKYKVQTSTAVAGVDFEYVKDVITWGNGESGVKYVEVPTYKSGSGKTLRVKLSTLTQGAYLGCVTPHVKNAKVYVPLR